jgi:hypothetical protein
MALSWKKASLASSYTKQTPTHNKAYRFAHDRKSKGNYRVGVEANHLASRVAAAGDHPSLFNLMT